MMQFVIMVYDDVKSQTFSTKMKLDGVEPAPDNRLKMTPAKRDELRAYAVGFAAQQKIEYPVYAVYAYRYENGNATMQLRRLEDIKKEFTDYIREVYKYQA